MVKHEYRSGLQENSETNKVHIQNLGKYIDIVKNKWLNKIKER